MNALRTPARLMSAARRLLAPTPRRPRSVRLALHGLEDRTTPAKVYTVTTTTEPDMKAAKYAQYRGYYDYVGQNLAFDAQDNAFNVNGDPITLGEVMFANSYFNGFTGQPYYPGPSVVNFNVPGTGVHTFHFTPNVQSGFSIGGQGGMTINGWSQLGSSANTAAFGQADNAKVKIEFDGRLGVYQPDNTIQGISVKGIDFYRGDRQIGGNVVTGSYLGLRADGKTPWGDTQEGVFIDGTVSGTRIGGPNPADRNVIAGHNQPDPHFGNVGRGVYLGTAGNTVEGNYIGTDSTGKTKVGDLMSGVQIKASGNYVFQNVIAFNSQYAVQVDSGFNNKISGNLMFSNSKGGISLAAGANGDADAPVLTGSVGATVSGTLSTAADKTYRIEVFSSPGKDPAGQYEGKDLIGVGDVTTVNGVATFTIDLARQGDFITATATDPDGNTSAFSNAVKGGGDVGVKSVTAKLAKVAAPGEANVVYVTVQNKSADKVTANGGTALIKVYDGPGKKYLFAEYDVPAGTTQVLDKGQSRTFPIKFEFPDIGDPNAIDPGTYQYYVELDPAWKGKVGSSASTFEYVNSFGTVNGVRNVTATVRLGGSPAPARDAGGGEETFALTGPGTGTITRDGDGNTNLSFTGTTSATTVTAKDLGGLTGRVHNIDAPGDIGTLDLSDVDADGVLTFGGALRKLSLHDFGGTGARLSAKAVGELEFHSIRDATVSADSIDRLGTGAWVSDGAENTLFAHHIGTLIVKSVDDTTSGDFVPDVSIQGTTVDGQWGLDKAQIYGTVRDSGWTVAGDEWRAVKSINVGSASNWTLDAKGGDPDTKGRVDSLWVKGGLNSPASQQVTGPAIQAESIGTLKVVGTLNATGILLTGFDARMKASTHREVAIETLSVGTVEGLDALTAEQGGIQNLGAGDWEDDTAVKTKWIDRLSSAGDFAADLELTGSVYSLGDSLNWVRVKGRLSGTWELFSNVGPVEAGTIGGWAFQGGVEPGSTGSTLASLTSHGALDGVISARGIGKVAAAGPMTGSLTLTVGPGLLSRLKPIPSLTLGGFYGTITTPGDIGTITVGEWGDDFRPAKLDARYVQHLLILGHAKNGTFNLSQGATSFIAGSMAGCTVNAAGQTIAVFQVRGIKGEQAPFFSGTTVTAKTFGLIQINDAYVDPGPNPTAYGITADFVAAYSRFVNGKAVVFTVNGKKTTVLAFVLAGVPDQAGGYSLTVTEGGKPPPA